MQTFESVPVRYLPPGPEELSHVMGGSRSWHHEEPSTSSADASDQNKPEIPRIRHADLQAWIEKRMAQIKRRPLEDRIAAALESE
jgi:hypothetical protein